MKKPGLLKRMFSFGRKKVEEETPVVEEQVAIEVEPPVETPSTQEDVAESTEIEPAADIAEIKPSDEPVQTAAVVDETDSEPEQSDEPSGIEEQFPSQEGEATVPVADVVEADPQATEAVEEEEPEADVELVEAIEPTSADVEPSEVEVIQDAPTTSHIITKTEEKPEDAEPQAAPERTSWFKRLSQGLSRSSSQLTENIAAVFTKKMLDDAALEDLEDILLQADLGLETATKIVDSLAKQRMGKDVSDEEVRGIMAEEIEKVLMPVAKPLELDLEHKPHVILVVGVNGSGKTTTIGKLSQKLNDGGYSTMLVAGDTFRAAAIEQLNIWGERTGSPVVSKPLGSDSSGLAFDAWQQANEQGSDVLMMDTAGRLQNRTELMAELEKIIRVFKKKDPTAPHTVLLTLDATTGQNALSQVEIFGKVAGVNGLIMTKLDGSARGGILVAISSRFQLPVYFLGVGEQVEDLEPFEAGDFARSIAGLDN